MSEQDGQAEPVGWSREGQDAAAGQEEFRLEDFEEAPQRRPQGRPPEAPDPRSAIVMLTRPAAEFVAKRGSRIYIWTSDLGDAWITLHASTDPPSLPIDFVLEPPVAGCDVYLSDDLAVPKWRSDEGQWSIGVRLGRFPHRHLIAFNASRSAFWHE